MRKHLLISAVLALAAGLGLASFGVQATPITVDLSGCGGLASCTNSGVTFTGWEYNGTDGIFETANLTYKADGANETGLGVKCTYGTGDKCSQKEINTAPEQYIAASLPSSFSSLSLGVGSVDSGGGGNYPETAYIYGATTCDNNNCAGGLLTSFTFGDDGSDVTHIFTFTPTDLSGYSYLYVSPVGGYAPDGNVLLASLSYTVNVPEPAVLGMFGLGVLLIGLFTGLRRRMH